MSGIFAGIPKDSPLVVQQYDMDGKLERTITLPSIGTATGFGTKKEEKETYYTFTSYIYPPTIFKLDIATGTSTVYKKSGVQFDPDQYESKQVFYTSKDETRIPMIITYKKGMKLKGKNPTMLYGYGGFNISLTPAFQYIKYYTARKRRYFAVPNIRGGGEYGGKWHKAGIKMKKQKGI